MILRSATGKKYAVLTAEQLNDFPVEENFGYLIGLASKLDENDKIKKVEVNNMLYAYEGNMLIGDIDSNGVADMSDLTAMSLYFLDEAKFSVIQKAKSDVNGDGKVNIADLAHLRQYVSGMNVKLGK